MKIKVGVSAEDCKETESYSAENLHRADNLSNERGIKMKKEYTEPETEIILYSDEDIIMASGDTGTSSGGT